MKMKEFGPLGAHIPGVPLDLPLAYPIKLAHDVAYIPALFKINQKGANVAPFLRKLNF